MFPVKFTHCKRGIPNFEIPFNVETFKLVKQRLSRLVEPVIIDEGVVEGVGVEEDGEGGRGGQGGGAPHHDRGAAGAKPPGRGAASPRLAAAGRRSAAGRLRRVLGAYPILSYRGTGAGVDTCTRGSRTRDQLPARTG